MRVVDSEGTMFRSSVVESARQMGRPNDNTEGAHFRLKLLRNEKYRQSHLSTSLRVEAAGQNAFRREDVT